MPLAQMSLYVVFVNKKHIDWLHKLISIFLKSRRNITGFFDNVDPPVTEENSTRVFFIYLTCCYTF